MSEMAFIPFAKIAKTYRILIFDAISVSSLGTVHKLRNLLGLPSPHVTLNKTQPKKITVVVTWGRYPPFYCSRYVGGVPPQKVT